MADARKTPMPRSIEYLKPSQVDIPDKKLLGKDAMQVKNSLRCWLGRLLFTTMKRSSAAAMFHLLPPCIK